MENNYLYYNINSMSRNELYRTAQNLATDLGYNLQPLRQAYRRSTTAYWQTEVRNYQRNIRNRNNTYNRALRISRENREPLARVAIQQGTDYAYWQREVRRLQMRARRNPLGIQAVQQARAQVAPILQEVRQPDNLQRQRQQRRTRQIRDNIALSRFTVNTRQLVNGATRREFIHNVPNSVRERLNVDSLDEIRRQILQTLRPHRQAIEGRRIKIMVEDTRTGNIISSSYLVNKAEALDRLMIEQLGPKAREYDDDNTFEVGRITIAIFIPPQNVMGGSNSRSIKQANDKWHIVNPKSRFNCVFQSVACCKNFLNNKLLILDTEEASKKRIIAGKNLKGKIKPSNDNYVDNMTLQEIADWTKYPINLYDNIFKLIKTFNPKKPLGRYITPIKHYDIQKVGDHCLALIDKKLIKSKYPDFNFNVIENKEEEKEVENTQIKKKRSFDEYNYKIASWDIETSPNAKGEHIPYACSIAWFNYEYGEDTITHINKKTQTLSENQMVQRWFEVDEEIYNYDFEANTYVGIVDNEYYHFYDDFNKYKKGEKFDEDDLRYLNNYLERVKKKSIKECRKALISKWVKSEKPIYKSSYKKQEKRTKNIIKSTPEEKQFWGLDCLQKMTTYIHDNKERFNGYTLYAHNGGKYDLPLAIKKAFMESPEFLIEGKGCVELNNAWIGFTLRAKDDRKFKIYFRDSLRLLPMGLAKLTKELKVPHQKLHETINHNDITLINYNTFPQLKTYLTHDVFGLLEVIQKFGQGVFKDLGIDITNCYTGASLSKKNFFKNYYDTKFPVFKLSDDNDKFIRDSYFGGRVECFQIGEVDRCYYYDFTSLYPDVGRKLLPYGEPEIVKLNKAKKLDKSFFGWVECLVRTKNTKHIPKHAVLKDDRLIFPIFENWTKINLFSEELDYQQYEYEFITGVKFKKSRIKQKFFNDGFRNKAKAKAEGNPAMAQAYKIIINSGYGFWGLRTKDRDGVIICEPNSHKYMEYLNTDKLVSIREQGDYVLCRIKKDLDVCDFNVSVAAAISSYARSKLHKMLTAIRKVGGKVYYCDTDSVICNININDYPNIKKKFQWDGDGTELGSLKNECDEYIEGIVKKEHPNYTKEQINKEVELLLLKENGNFSFDKGLLTGCKQYALQKKINYNGKDHIIEIVKCKGYSQKDDKLKFSDMESLNSGINMKQKQTQFRCPKSNYVSETNAFIIKSKVVEKSFRKTYTKGQIFGKYVLPHRI